MKHNSLENTNYDFSSITEMCAKNMRLKYEPCSINLIINNCNNQSIFKYMLVNMTQCLQIHVKTGKNSSFTQVYSLSALLTPEESDVH